jgi:hypothetical protein
MARIGSVPAAPFVGDQFVSLYLGATRVPTVPGRPVISLAEDDSGDLDITLASAIADGGSAIADVRLYLVGEGGTEFQYELASLSPTQFIRDGSGIAGGDVIRVSAVNAVGEGPLSAPFTVTLA